MSRRASHYDNAKPSDYIFCVFEDVDEEQEPCIYITPKDYFLEEGHMWDQSAPEKVSEALESIDSYEECEGMFSAPDDMDEKEVIEKVKSLGFEFSKSFENFIKRPR